MTKKTLLALSVVGALFTSSAVANDYEYEITPTFGGVMPEGNLDLDDQLSYGLRIGKNLHQSWFNQVELALEYAPRVDVEKTGGQHVNIFRGSVNLIKDIPLLNRLSLYGLVGAGGEILNHNLRDNNDRLFVDYGAGLKYRFTDRLATKLEARHAIKLNAAPDEYTQNNLFYTLGLSYAFGGNNHVAYKPKKIESANAVDGGEVVEEVAAGDDDRDGVVNNMDECPNTPKGVAVDDKGCPVTVSLHINFNTGKSNIAPRYDAEIGQVAKFMNKFPAYKVTLEGYTDSVGSKANNLKLSDRRSASVAKALKKKGVKANRISTVGYGESNPVASNKTKAGRAENRRVDAVFSY